MTVKELIVELKKHPKEHKVVFHERKSIYDTSIDSVYESQYDKDRKRNRIVIQG